MKKNKLLLLLAAGYGVSLLAGCTPPVVINYSTISVPEEGGIKFSRITSDDDHFLGSPLRWSPYSDSWRYDLRNRFSLSGDGTKLAYMARKNNKINIFIRSLEAGTANLQRTFRDFVIDPCLSPDGKSLAFSEFRNGAWNIYETSAEGGSAIRQITGDNYNNLYPQYSPDQAEILYTQLAYTTYQQGDTVQTLPHSSLWSYNLQTARVTQYGEGFCPSFSADKSKVVVTRYNPQSATTELWLLDLDKGAETIIFSQKKRGAVEPAVSPKGDMVAFVSLTEASDQTQVPANLDIYLIKIDGTNLTQLTFHAGNDISPRWAPDGTSLYFASQRGTVKGEWNIWKMDLPESFLKGETPIRPPENAAVPPPVAQPVVQPLQTTPTSVTGASPAAGTVPGATGSAAVGADTGANKNQIQPGAAAGSSPSPNLNTPSSPATTSADSNGRVSAYEALKGMNVIITTTEGKELRGRLLDAQKDVIEIDFFGTPLSMPMTKIKSISVAQ